MPRCTSCCCKNWLQACLKTLRLQSFMGQNNAPSMARTEVTLGKRAKSRRRRSIMGLASDPDPELGPLDGELPSLTGELSWGLFS